MTRYVSAVALLVTVAWTLVGCTPALNWREIRLDSLVGMLPCKPDRGERAVRLAAHELQMAMLGCEADGALFAISHVRAVDHDAVAVILSAWQASAFGKMQSTAVQEGAAIANPRGGAPRSIYRARGARPDGSPVEAQLTWFSVGTDIFHAVVYATRLSPEMTEPFFSELRTP